MYAHILTERERERKRERESGRERERKGEKEREREGGRQRQTEKERERERARTKPIMLLVIECTSGRVCDVFVLKTQRISILHRSFSAKEPSLVAFFANRKS